MKKGFTLIELLVVVLIIGVLSAVALPQYRKAVAKAQASEALKLGKVLVDAQNVYFISNNAYTEDFDSLDVKVENTEHYEVKLNTYMSEESIPKGVVWLSKIGSGAGITRIAFYLGGGSLELIDCIASGSQLNSVCSALLPCVTRVVGSSTICRL